MRRSIFLLIGALFLIFSASAYAEGNHKYIGVKKCSMCHRADQYKPWSEAKHSRAYEILKSDAAKKSAEAKGIKVPPTEAPECLKCHVTGYGEDASLFGEKFKKEDGVQCESCHGAGGDYYKKSIMQDQEKAIANGLVLPTEEVCVKCHNSESPNFEGFVFEEFYNKIAHPYKK